MTAQAVLQSGPPRFCLGVPVGNMAAGQVPHAPEVVDGFDAVNDHLAAAIKDVRNAVQADRVRAVDYPTFQSPIVGAGGPMAPAAPSTVSLFEDCGLPIVRASRGFIDNIAGELTPGTVPFVGFGSNSDFGVDAISPLWQNPPLAILHQFIPVGFPRLRMFQENVSFLARMNHRDEIWQNTQAARAGTWFATFGGGLSGYMSELFADRFIDRNGTSISLNLGGVLKDLTKIDAKTIAPQIAGAILSALAEFLGDALFRVPYYSSAVLATYRDYRKTKRSADDVKVGLDVLVQGGESGRLAASDAFKYLGWVSSGANGSRDLILEFDHAMCGLKETPLIKSNEARRFLLRVGQLDADYLNQVLSLSEAGSALDDIEQGHGEVVGSFTCFKAGVIQERLGDVFVTDEHAQGIPGRDHDTGRLDGPTTDYADLIGKLVMFGGRTAEKSVRSLVGGLIRGVAIASLQNEVLAEVIDGFAGTLAKKLVESVVYRGLVNFIRDDGTSPEVRRQTLKVLAQWHGLVDGGEKSEVPAHSVPGPAATPSLMAVH